MARTSNKTTSTAKKLVSKPRRTYRKHNPYSDDDPPVCTINVELKARVSQVIPVPEEARNAELFVLNGFTRNHYLWIGWISPPDRLTVPEYVAKPPQDVAHNPEWSFLHSDRLVMIADRDMSGIIDFYLPLPPSN